MDRPGFFLPPAKLHTIADDLDRVLAGRGPTPRELQQAPILENWKLVWAQTPVLLGTVSGHPGRRNGLIMSSQVYAIDADTQAWARTASRWYRLGAKGGS